ncbi:hypothetical protein ACFV6G_34085 [Streptomyces lavendulae]|uniref:hypothetical protein n=1 Tax=Streptomyces lavendulae TaxID=1914 RepID=UPI00367B194D
MYKNLLYKIRWYLRQTAASLVGAVLAGAVVCWAAGDGLDPGDWTHMAAGTVVFMLVWHVTVNVLLRSWVHRHPDGRPDQR